MNSTPGDKILISLVGSDPISILLTARFLDLSGNVLIHTPETRDAAQRLEKMLPGCGLLEVDSWEFYKNYLQVIAFLDPSADYQFNLSDGSRELALISAFLLNLIEAPLYILNRGGVGDDLYTYSIEDGKIQPPEVRSLPGLLTLGEYLQVCVGEYAQVDPTAELAEGRQEIRDLILNFVKLLRRTAAADEDLIGVKLTGPRGEITLDLMMRIENQVSAVIFRRESADLTRAIDLLGAAGQESCLGPQTHRFLVIDGSLEDGQLFSAAETQGISIVTLSRPSAGSLREGEIQRVLESILAEMSSPKRSSSTPAH